MPRARRDWTAMLAEIRRLLRETTAASSFWSDALLLDLFNQSIDLWVMRLAATHEGWVTDRLQTDTVADQRQYTIPEGVGRIKRVLMQHTQGNTVVEYPLRRAERFGTSLVTRSGTNQLNRTQDRSYRIVGDLLYIEPPPTEAVTNGLILEVESAPSRLTTGTDKLDQRFPDAAETLFIYETVILALAVEDAQGADTTARLNALKGQRDLYAASFQEFVEQRSYGLISSEPFYTGD